MNKAYIIANVQVTDPEQYKVYQQFSSQAISEHKANILVRGGEVEALEGDVPGRTVVLEFPSRAAARAFYDSETYRQARAARRDAANMTMFIVEGLPG